MLSSPARRPNLQLGPLLLRVGFPAAAAICVVVLYAGRHFGAASNRSANAKTVAFITPASTNEFNVELVDGARTAAKALDWNPVLVFAPQGDSDDAQLEDLAYKALARKPDAISVCGMGSQSLSAIVSRANRAGIPIFVHNQINPVSGDVAAYVGYDENEAGRKCGEHALELLGMSTKSHVPAGQVAILDGGPGDHSSQRTEGFRDALKFSAGVQIVEEKSANWSNEQAKAITLQWLSRYPKLALVFACNDAMAEGAAQALYTFNLNNHDRVLSCMGFGGSQEALFKVKSGTLASTLALDPRKMGAKIVHNMMDLFGGSASADHIQRTEVTLVTSANVDTFMGGFASEKQTETDNSGGANAKAPQ